MTGSQRSSARLVAEEDATLIPKCPHCSAELSAIRTRQLEFVGGTIAGFGKRHVYACPECRAVLGISHRKGFWMG